MLIFILLAVSAIMALLSMLVNSNDMPHKENKDNHYYDMVMLSQIYTIPVFPC